MSFDRYLAVTKAFAFSAWVKKMRSSTASVIITVFGWLISVLASYPLIQYSDVTECPRMCAHEFPHEPLNEDCVVVNVSRCYRSFRTAILVVALKT